MRPAVFLDRDDTLIANRTLAPSPGGRPGDLCEPERVRLLPGTLDGCRLLAAAGFPLVIVSNQSLVARGVGTIEDVEATNQRVRTLLVDEQDNPLITAAYYSPHHPEGVVQAYAGDHPWRKPRPGMFEAAGDELGLDLARSWMVGDQPRDMEAAQRAGIPPDRTILLDEGVPGVLCAALMILGRDSAHDHGAEMSTASLHVEADAESPLRDAGVRGMVESAARALGERIGVRVERIEIDEGGVRAILQAGRLVAFGFAAELRRITDAWHLQKRGVRLWPGPAEQGGDAP